MYPDPLRVPPSEYREDGLPPSKRRNPYHPELLVGPGEATPTLDELVQAHPQGAEPSLGGVPLAREDRLLAQDRFLDGRFEALFGILEALEPRVNLLLAVTLPRGTDRKTRVSIKVGEGSNSPPPLLGGGVLPRVGCSCGLMEEMLPVGLEILVIYGGDSVGFSL